MLRYLTLCSALISSVLSATTLLQFPNATWLENVAVCANGGILLTELKPEPALLYVDPSKNPASAQTVYAFPAPATGISGIATLGNNIFYVTSLQFNFTTLLATPGSGQLWRVDMTNHSTSHAAVTLITNLTDIIFPNGATALPGSNHVLIADYAAGKVFGVNVRTGITRVAVDNAAVNVPSGAAGGVNGVHAPGDGFLYFTNSGTHTYGRISIDATGRSTSLVQVLFQNTTVTPDDFALDWSSGPAAAYIADSSGNRIAYVSGISNRYRVVADIAGPTSTVVSGTGIHVSSTGGDYDYVQNPIPVGGALSRL